MNFLNQQSFSASSAVLKAVGFGQGSFGPTGGAGKDVMLTLETTKSFALTCARNRSCSVSSQCDGADYRSYFSALFSEDRGFYALLRFKSHGE
ncbi:MAG: hypothetical protein AAF756_21695 [Pseudomonadota bacterium]